MIDFILWAAMLSLLPLIVFYIAFMLYSRRAAIIAALMGKVR